MSIRTGIFTVGVAGVYQLSFTAKYVSSSKGRFGAWSDMYVNNTVSNSKARSLLPQVTDTENSRGAPRRIIYGDKPNMSSSSNL